MPEQKMSYQERLEIEKKAVAITVNAFTEDLIFDTEPEIIESAKSNIAAQTEAIREAVKCVNDYDTIDDESILSAIDNWIEEYLLKHGYIEPKN